MAKDLILVLSMLCCSQMQIINAIVPGACKAWQYRCQNGECIDLFLLCDGGPDCQDGSDELKCGSQVNKAHPLFFRCRGSGRIITSNKRCDGDNNCRDESDEWNCPKLGQCNRMQYRCNDGTCIMATKVCDKTIDCGDASDELFCSRFQDLGLHSAWVLGCDGDKIRLPLVDRCDGHTDCHDLLDEANCSMKDTKCNWRKLKCDGDDTCLDLTSDRCDGHKDCLDGTDEANCRPVVNCTGEFTCDNAMCVPLSARCDGHNDCGDASDEWGCPKLPQSCSVHEFQCDNGRCVPKEARCDGFLHCVDASDEWECTDFTKFCKALNPGYTAAATLGARNYVTSGERTALILTLVVIMVLLVLFIVIIYLGAQHLRRIKDYHLNPRVSLSTPGKSSPPREFM